MNYAFQLTRTGFVINGNAPMTDEAAADYTRFSPHGIVEQYDGPHPSARLLNGTLPIFHQATDVVNMDVPTAAKAVCNFHSPSHTHSLTLSHVQAHKHFAVCHVC